MKTDLHYYVTTAVLFLIGFLTFACSYAENPPSRTSLGGFEYNIHIQDFETFDLQFLDHGYEEDSTLYLAYLLDEPTATYVVFFFPLYRSEYVYGIQITGKDTEQRLFDDLYLGMDKERALKTLGPPSDTNIIHSRNTTYTQFSFDKRNYSAQFGPEEKLYSFSLRGDEGVLTARGWHENWERFEPYTIMDAIDDYKVEAGSDTITFSIYGADITFRPRVTFTGEVREISENKSLLIEHWAGSMSMDTEEVTDMYRKEIQVEEFGNTYWIPIQDGVLEGLHNENLEGEELDLFISMAGQYENEVVMLCNAFIVF